MLKIESSGPLPIDTIVFTYIGLWWKHSIQIGLDEDTIHFFNDQWTPIIISSDLHNKSYKTLQIIVAVNCWINMTPWIFIYKSTEQLSSWKSILNTTEVLAYFSSNLPFGIMLKYVVFLSCVHCDCELPIIFIDAFHAASEYRRHGSTM